MSVSDKVLVLNTPVKTDKFRVKLDCPTGLHAKFSDSIRPFATASALLNVLCNVLQPSIIVNSRLKVILV